MVVFNSETNTFHVEHFSEGEIAHYLQLRGINKLDSKQEKLKFARSALEPIMDNLWLHAKASQIQDERKQARYLAIKLDSLQGLMSVVKLAGVLDETR